MDPVSMMVAAWLGEWATVKIAEVLLGGVTTPLTKGDLGKALQKCGEVADREVMLFYSCEPRFVPKLLDRVFKDLGVQELQKPLKNEGIPNLDYLVYVFKLALDNHPQVKGNIREDLIEPWLRAFVKAYFEKSQEYLKFQVAKADYFEQLANWFDDVKFAGISVPGQEVDKSAQLAHIFVMPDVVEEGNLLWDGFEPDFLLEGMGNRQGDLFREQRIRSQSVNRSGRKFLAQQLLSQSQSHRFVLLGAPGVGKTTLMSYFAVIIAQKHPEQLGLSLDTDWLPILIKMRDFARYPDLSILDYAQQFAEKNLSVKGLPTGFFEYWLEDGRALILLDGLDEVAEEAKRYDVVRRIENFLGQFKRNRAIITSRPAGYKRDFFKTEEFPHYELQSFDDPKIEEFINRWYDSRVSDKAEAIRRKDSLRKALAENDRIKLLARNPLLLTIIALIHRYQALLPRERYKLYDKAVETLLTSWDANKELSDTSGGGNHQTILKYLGLDDWRRLMERLAYWIHTLGSTGDKEGGTIIDRDELISKLSKEIKALKQIQLYEAKQEAQRFVDFIRERTGLLNEQGQDCYAFVHKTFQEYLVAQDINYQADNEDDFDIVLNYIDTYLYNPHWQEVLVLLITQQKPKKAAKAIRKILERHSEYEEWLHRDLLWAGKLLTENIKDLQVADSGLIQDILAQLVNLEVDDESRVGRRVSQEVFQIICRLNESDFEAQALELLKQSADKIDEKRLLEYRAALGEKDAVIQHYLEKLQDKDNFWRTSFALRELGQHSETVVNALLLRLDDENPVIRRNAAIALGNLRKNSETVINALILRLDDENSDVRRIATYALGKLGQNSETVINALLLRLDDENSDVRSNTAFALGNLGKNSETVINALLLCLDDENSDVRRIAAFTLGNLGKNSETVVNALLLRLDDEDSTVRRSATYALGELGQNSETVINALLLRLDDENSDVRSNAANALGKLGQNSETVVNALVLRLDDENSDVRRNAIDALSKLGENSETVVNALVLRLDDENSDVRRNAANALGELGQNSETVVNALLLRLDDENSDVRRSATYTLGKLGKNNSNFLTTIIAWIQQHQDSDYIGSGIDVLWDLLSVE